MLEDESDPSDPDYATHGEEEIDYGESDSDSENDEEVMENFHVEIEDVVALFRDELPIRHNLYPDSESDDEDVVVIARNRGERMIRGRGDGNLQKGKVFYSGVMFKEAVLDHALREGRNIKQYKWDKTNLGYRCAIKPCEWRIYCSINNKMNIWEVKIYHNDHPCTRNGHCEMLTDPVIARLFLDKIRKEPDYMMPMKIQELVYEQWKLVVTRNQCQEARNKALKWIQKEYENQFAHIRGYCSEIIDSNKDSTVALETILGPDGEDLFDRFYVCFDIIKRSWKNTCRPLIGVDGTFLKSTLKGQLLAAIGRDACNKMYPIAWAVVQEENEKNWLWFIKMVKSDLDLKDGDGFIITSDRQKV